MSTKAMSPEIKEVFIFWAGLALGLIGTGYIIKYIQRRQRPLIVEKEQIVWQCPDIVLTEENELAKADLDKRTGHTWMNKNALLLLNLERDNGILFDKRLPRLFAEFGVSGIARLIELQQHQDVKPAKVED